MDFDYMVVPSLIFVLGLVVVWWSLRRIASLPAKGLPKRRRITQRVLFSVVAVLTIAVVASTSFNAIARLWFRAHNPPPGSTYTVDGHKMYMYCTGTGSPTLVLDAGLGNDSAIWGGVQPVLAKTTRVCAFDRAGFGFSEPRPGPRDADHIASELNDLLLQAHITGPIVLMGHSISGIYMRAYASRYPQNIAGIVFVDGSTPMQQDNPAFKAMDKGPPPWAIEVFGNAASIAGGPRLMGQCSTAVPGMNAQASKWEAEDSCQMHIGAAMAEMKNLKQSGLETIHSGPYGALPLLILSQDPAKSLSAKKPGIKDVGIAWNQMQENLKSLSTRSRRIIAKGSSHYIQLERADLIDKEVPLFIRQIRGTAPLPTNFGTTVTE